MAGIYLHIPFCKKACIYCDFHFSTNTNQKSMLVAGILQELALRKAYLQEHTLSSVYFGGGTPSLLSDSELNSLLEQMHRLFRLSPDAEITLEANPDDLSKEKLKSLKNAGVNRLSIGIQSFRNEDLEWMNRSHTASQAERSVKVAQDMGLENISIDLIYALPNLSDNAWHSNMEQAIALQVPHISAYSLTVEEKTVLNHKIQQGALKPVADETALRHFEGLKHLHQAGFIPYEVSNLAQAGHEAVHNSNYWAGEAYLGVGPSAHSFNGTSRQWNVANNALYMKGIQGNALNFEQEVLTEKDQYNEWVMTQLRKLKGVCLPDVKSRFGEAFLQYILTEAAEEIGKGNLVLAEDYLYIPQSRRFYSDGIAASLFYL
jgi:oxygen-independent coproporphyrinogen-3 oxidase